MTVHDVHCAYCSGRIVLSGPYRDDPATLTDLPVYKRGELAYIEIAHTTCVPTTKKPE